MDGWGVVAFNLLGESQCTVTHSYAVYVCLCVMDNLGLLGEGGGQWQGEGGSNGLTTTTTLTNNKASGYQAWMLPDALVVWCECACQAARLSA